MSREKARRRWWTVLSPAIVLLAIACGSGGHQGDTASATGQGASKPAASPRPTSTSAVCQDVTALRASLDKLTTTKISASTAEELKADVQGVKGSLSDLASSAGNAWHAQISNVESALATLETKVNGFAAAPSASGAADVAAAVGKVATAGRDLLAAAGSRCPSPSASPTHST